MIDSRRATRSLSLCVWIAHLCRRAVLKNSKVTTALAEPATGDQLRNYLDGLSDEDLGRYKM